MATGTEVAQEVFDAADSVLEEASEAVDTARQFTQRDAGLVSIGLGVGVVLGAVGGYYILHKQIKTKYDHLADEEIAKMREHYNQKLMALEGEEEKKSLDIVKREGYKSDPRQGGGPVPYHTVADEPDQEPEEVDETRNAVEETKVEDDGILNLDPQWDYAKEIKSRDPMVPYIIHYDEHKEGPQGPEDYEKLTLTYFAGDDVLCNERDQIIEDQDEAIGLGNLSRFGHGSGDPNTVYIRNDAMKVDIEVVRSDGKYAIQVAGFKEDDLQHSATMSRRLPRRSEYDDDMER